MADDIEQKPSKAKAEKKPVEDGLVTVTKGGVELRIHPNHVHEHGQLGWVQVSE